MLRTLVELSLRSRGVVITLAAGLIVGESLVGVLMAGLIVAADNQAPLAAIRASIAG